MNPPLTPLFLCSENFQKKFRYLFERGLRLLLSYRFSNDNDLDGYSFLFAAVNDKLGAAGMSVPER